MNFFMPVTETDSLIFIAIYLVFEGITIYPIFAGYEVLVVYMI